MNDFEEYETTADGTFNEVSKHSKKRTAVEGVNQND